MSSPRRPGRADHRHRRRPGRSRRPSCSREAGATVVGCDIAPTDGSEPVDLTDEDAVRRWVDAAAAAHGGIDVLYANAGATRFGPLESITAEDWDFNLRHELDVVFFPVKHAWRHLKASRRPRWCSSARPPASPARPPTPASRTPSPRAASSR